MISSDNTTLDFQKQNEWEKRREFLCFLFLMGFALTLRLWKFGVIPGGMNQDGAMAAVDAKALADYGTDRFGMFLPVHFTAWGYGQMSVFLSYCMIPFFKLFGMSSVTARLPILLASMAGLAALYGIGKRLLGGAGGLLILGFASLNPWHFMQSRWALDCNMFPHVFLIGLYLLLLGMEGRKAALYLSMFFFACSMYCYGIAFYTVPVFLILMGCYLTAKKLIRIRELACCVMIYIGLSWPIYVTMMINAFGWHTIETPFCTMPSFPGSIRANDILFFSDHKGQQLWANVKSLIAIYREGDQLPWNTIPGFGAVSVWFLPFTFLGLIRLVQLFWKEKEAGKRAAFLAILFYFLIGNLSGLITANVNVNRINILFYALILLTGFGLETAWRKLHQGAWLIVLCYAVISVFFLKTYFTEHGNLLSYYYFSDFVEAVSFAGEKVPNAKYCITPVVRGQDAATNTAEILTLFAQGVDAEFFQGKKLDKNGLSYVEKYQYRTLGDEEIPDPAFVYVITKNDAAREIWENSVLFPCGDYYIAIFYGKQ